MDKNTCSRLLLSTVILTMLVVMAACSGGSTLNVQNPLPPTQGQAVTVVFQPAPPSSVPINGTAQVTAVVQNDPSNAGVDWSLTCPQTGNCGSLSSQHTSSGQPVTYSPPVAISGNNETVSIVAFAVADNTKNVKGQLTITAFGSVLAGTYVVGTSGSDFSGFPYQRAGVITLDGNGKVVAGERTVNFVNPNTGLLSSVTDSVTGGSYFVGGDGRGQLVINTNNVTVGQNGAETFDMVVLSSSHALLSKLDDPNIAASSNEVSTGMLDLQTSAPAPSLGYAFVARGADINVLSMALGGVLNIDSPLAISGAGSAFDIVNPTLYGPGVVVPSSAVSGTLSAPDSFGTFQVSVATDFANPIKFTAYPIDGTRAKLIESDGSFAFTVGDLYSQGASTGTYLGKGKFKGSYVFGVFGQDLGGGSASLTAAGLFSATVSTTGVSTLSNGFLDESQSDGLVQIDDHFQAAYAVGPGSDPTVITDPAGTGRYYIPTSAVTGFPDFTFTNHANGTGPAWVFYMIAPGGPALMLDADIEPTLASGSGTLFGGGVGTGIAYPVVAGAPISGLYGAAAMQNVQGISTEILGEITSNNDNLSGLLDFNGGFGPELGDTSLSGTIQPGPVPNRFHGPLSDTFFINDLGTTSLKMAFYPIDATQGFLLEHDLADSTGTPVSGDVTFGYYFARTPVCQGCP
ncbi:MAG: hypothetical protein WCF26_26275 [Candidatus Sulfotelmatobacter sp.]